MRTIGVVTTARSDYGIYLPILRRIEADDALKLHLIVSGMHLSPEFGMTVDVIEKDGFIIGDRVEMLLSSDSPEGVAKSVGLGVIGFSQVFARNPPDILLVLGDRFEMLAAALASVPSTIPLAHIHGGEVTEGAIDESFRHAITKMSHLHFVATEQYRDRVIQLGEEPWRVSVSGAPGLDNLHHVELLERRALEDLAGFTFKPAPLMVTYHPLTLDHQNTTRYFKNLLVALRQVDRPLIFTAPNADTGGRAILRGIEVFVKTRPKARLIMNLGTPAYFSLMKHAAVMVGNSSSGIIEAGSFELPVVNIGSRQRGRVRGPNVIDVDENPEAIITGIKKALSDKFRRAIAGMVNPYGDGGAAERIIQVLRETPLDHNLLHKRFHDIALSSGTS